MPRLSLFIALLLIGAAQRAAAISPVMPVSIGMCLAFEETEARMTPDTERTLAALVDAVQRTEGAVTALSLNVYFGPGVGAHLEQRQYVPALSLANRRIVEVVAALSANAAPVVDRLFGATVLTMTSGGPLFAPSNCASSVRVQLAPGAVPGCGRSSCTIACVANRCELKE